MVLPRSRSCASICCARYVAPCDLEKIYFAPHFANPLPVQTSLALLSDSCHVFTASLIVRSVPPSFVGSGEVSFVERYSGSNMAINSKRRRRTLNHGFEPRTPPGTQFSKGRPRGWPPQLGRAPLRLGRHEAEPSGQDFHRSVDVRRAERARVRRRPRRVRAAACNRRRPALGLPHRRWS
jgi:hypothetical protein